MVPAAWQGMRLRGRARRAARLIEEPKPYRAPIAGDAGGRMTVLVGVVQATHVLQFDFTPCAAGDRRGTWMRVGR